MSNDTVLPARSRWRLEAKSLPELSSYTVSVQHDYYSKFIGITVLDAIVKGKPVVHEWIVKTLNNPGEEVFTLHHHDAQGNLLYKKVLKGVKLIGHKCNHNYECEGDDLQDHELFFSYEDLQTIDNIN
jgi:hypothetical protein